MAKKRVQSIAINSEVITSCGKQNVVHEQSEGQVESTQKRLVSMDGLKQLDTGYVISQLT